MIETLVMPIATILISFGFSFLVVRYYYNRPPTWVQEFKDDLFTPIDDQGTTKLDTWIGRAVDSLFARFQFSAMGQKSGEARLEKGLQNAMMSDVIDSQSPLLGIVMEQFPQVKNYLLKHPNAIPQVLQMVAPLLQGKGFKGGSSNEYRSQF